MCKSCTFGLYYCILFNESVKIIFEYSKISTNQNPLILNENDSDWFLNILKKKLTGSINKIHCILNSVICIVLW